ncbi:MAG: serine/threonine protein kinase, partial [Candidatus Schekmanbacteria bacterium]|nr:serine/threonine protein kinase [Candidatus Schekmanbacteria bacterium]
SRRSTPARALAPTWESASALILERLDAASEATRAFAAALLASFAGVALVTADTEDALVGLGARVRRLEALAAGPAAELSRAVLGGPLAAGAEELLSAAPRLPGTLIDWLGEQVAAGRLRRGYDGTWEVGSALGVSRFEREDSGGRSSTPGADLPASGSEVTQETLSPPPPGGPPFHLPQRAREGSELNARPETPDLQLGARNAQRSTRNPLSPDELLARGHIGSCRLLSFIGQGGMGMVFRGELDGRQVAVKVTRMADARAAGRFRDEMRTLAALEHPHIVRMLDVAHDQVLGAVGLVMEYVPDSLEAWLDDPERSATLRGQAATRFLRDTLAALVYLETSGVLHLDLKPANILIEQGSDGVPCPKLADFGLARQAAAAGGGTGGTRAWAAPEMLARLVPACRDHHPDFAAMMPSPRSDYYAFGLIALRIYAGRVPFAEGDLEARFSWMPDIEDAIGAPRDVQSVLFRCLNPNPEKRPRSAMEILATWDEALGDDATDWPAIVASHLRAPALTTAARAVANAAVEVLRVDPDARIWVRGLAEGGRSRLLGAIASLAAIEGVGEGLRVVDGAAPDGDGPSGAIIAAGGARCSWRGSARTRGGCSGRWPWPRGR